MLLIARTCLFAYSRRKVRGRGEKNESKTGLTGGWLDDRYEDKLAGISRNLAHVTEHTLTYVRMIVKEFNEVA